MNIYMYIYILSRWAILTMKKKRSGKRCSESQNTFLMFNNILRKPCRVWDNARKFGRGELLFFCCCVRGGVAGRWGEGGGGMFRVRNWIGELRETERRIYCCVISGSVSGVVIVRFLWDVTECRVLRMTVLPTSSGIIIPVDLHQICMSDAAP
jgi:hypothetical protein